MKIPTYHDVLAQASRWRQSDAAQSLRDAEAALREGMKKFPTALPLGDELVLVLELQGRDEEALELLHELERRFQNAGEETLCRFGKLFKKRADGRAENPAAAMSCLELAEGYYSRAYEKSKQFYPRINQLTLRYLRAAANQRLRNVSVASELLQHVRSDVRLLLNEPGSWLTRSHDDQVWIPATQGEANILLGDWAAAEKNYETARERAGDRVFFLQTMAHQVLMLRSAANDLGFPATGRLCDADFFANRSELEITRALPGNFRDS